MNTLKKVGATGALSVAVIISVGAQAETNSQQAALSSSRSVSAVNHLAVGQALAANTEYKVKSCQRLQVG